MPVLSPRPLLIGSFSGKVSVKRFDFKDTFFPEFLGANVLFAATQRFNVLLVASS